jgi:DNA replication and repair protein RecF
LPKLKNISFFQYKNYGKQSFTFSKQITCLYGPNGIGKTNILDAIYYLGYTKSYFAKKDIDVVQHHQQGMFIQADVLLDDLQSMAVKMIIRENGKKEVQVNGEEIKQLNKYIGTLPSIMISPDDTELITEGGEVRRKYIDSILCQIDTVYFAHLIAYNKVMAMRNALLKNWHETNGVQWDVLSYYNTQLVDHGSYIFGARQTMLGQLVPLIQACYTAISKSKENITVYYDSKLINNTLDVLIKQSVDKDIILKRTNVGIHKDDLTIQINGYLCKDFASQGQRKTVLFALKMAQYQYLKQQLNITPILLLDDVFEKLDANRSQHLLHWITTENCQTFITDTHLDRLQNAFTGLQNLVEYVQVGGE